MAVDAGLADQPADRTVCRLPRRISSASPLAGGKRAVRSLDRPGTALGLDPRPAEPNSRTCGPAPR
eukprot:7464718-Alexandrium_andersonii.AAC.1